MTLYHSKDVSLPHLFAVVLVDLAVDSNYFDISLRVEIMTFLLLCNYHTCHTVLVVCKHYFPVVLAYSECVWVHR